MRALVTIMVLGILVIIGFALQQLIPEGLKLPLWLAWLIPGLLCGLFVYYGIRVIPADPPHKAVLVFLGKRQKKVLNEGWVWLPLAPRIFDGIMVKTVKINQDLPPQIVRTPDYAELEVKVSITWTPGITKKEASAREKAEALIEYLNSGEENGVKTIIEDIIKDRLRSWAFSEEEGPTNWQEAIGARDDAVAVLLKAILGEDLPSIESTIPLPVLLKYFSKRQPLASEKKWGGENKDWQPLEEELKKLPKEERKKLQKQVEERQAIIQKIKQGDGLLYKRALGITINRFTINEIQLRGKVAEAVEAAVREKYEQEADTIEIMNVLARVNELMKNLKISPEQALEIVQTERGKVDKKIQEGKLNISPETRQMIENLLALFSPKKSPPTPNA
ncbi:MAG: SPFH domain-containing protein [Minisyncoccales bacterium]